ncbi:short chain dehydrogenase/reductase family oxidoreductase [Burkholderia pseudomallei]|uniref:SDR family NAD(P)-dependent oxidoreductase n=1 Tax=Burkholderia pseudomallei TaxID=28450 RepID=UPI000F298B51|nr:SDR family oxidoreductase [Burkholderia pseudomallei]MBF4045571.1 SDR family oxidoreductase [Burkholderia pseudomallei]CAJ3584492.1 short chain dehydrogenase/reductase family oxidoreductase [Burkholderia pseudomallei]CAJ5543336.1 short chain dehydrogenase/reductase family oxidoreductase [Burkholderia pseudomallei]CAJ9851103.1 short chain dehydrogenase/reductase family oxidoreductase [Burkholderia pseudomallei]VCG79726.1 short chain dehydrogenase/reductase family oxidoreductase [Burkholderia
MFSERCLAGGTYLVTGASSGIGRAAAIAIAQLGGRLVLGGRDPARLADTLAALPGDGHASHAAALDDADAAADWVGALTETHGPLAGVFHAAGVELIRPARMTAQAQLEQVFGASLYAAFGIARAAAKKNVIADGGSVVYMSSVAGSTGQVGMTAYSAAKAGIEGLVRSLACELAPRRIRANAIAAGAVKTEMHARLTRGTPEDALAAYEASHLLGFGEPGDVAAAAIFLLSGASRWITGTSLVVDGGYKVR